VQRECEEVVGGGEGGEDLIVYLGTDDWNE
jgi:hypothetical protein